MANDEVRPKIAFDFVSYTGFVLDADKAVQLMELLTHAERYKTKFHSGGTNPDKSRNPSYTTEHAYTPTQDEPLFNNIRYLTAEQYAVAKVAGKPSEG